ncbi:hypothetical protein [Photorhabdus aegyptia]|uniref:hypothetical protein n=1 Tax=Photorhabdus aegyptia TaxID=2805098 RepID=UPI0013621124|nr:hypothetical protein [Photorhabdus aegyptia]
MEDSINVTDSLNICGDTDLSGAGCGSSASPVLRRDPTGEPAGLLTQNPII